MTLNQIKIALAVLLLWLAGVQLPANAQLYNAGIYYNAGAVYSQTNFINTSTAQWLNPGSFYITGNITNDQSAMDPSTGLLAFVGTTNQLVNGAMPYMSYNANIANNAGVTLSQILQINNTGTFGQGIVTAITPGIPLIFGTNGVPVGASNASHVNGVVRSLWTSGTFPFPVGDASTYKQIDAANISGNSQGLDAAYYAGDAGKLPFSPNGGKDPDTLKSYSPLERWIMKPVVNDVTANVTIYYGSGMTTTGSQSDLRVAHKTNTAWWNEGNTATTGTLSQGSVTSAPIDVNQWSVMTTDPVVTQNVGWAPFTLGSVSMSTPLPLTLLSFKGDRVSGNDHLQWSTGVEINTAYFDVQYSTNGRSFSSIGTVTAAGNSNTVQNYNYTHSNVSDDAYYRLRMVDIDGTATYSPVIKLSGNGTPNGDCLMIASVYPVPFYDELNVSISSCKDLPGTIMLYTATGRVVAKYNEQLKKGTFNYKLDGAQISGLASGTYVLGVNTTEGIITRQVIKQ